MKEQGTHINAHNSKEWLILMTLVRAVSDQSLMLQGTEKQRAKQILKSFDKEANRLNNQFNKMFEDVVLDECSDVIHEALKHLRKEIEVIE